MIDIYLAPPQGGAWHADLQNFADATDSQFPEASVFDPSQDEHGEVVEFRVTINGGDVDGQFVRSSPAEREYVTVRAAELGPATEVMAWIRSWLGPDRDAVAFTEIDPQPHSVGYGRSAEWLANILAA